MIIGEIKNFQICYPVFFRPSVSLCGTGYGQGQYHIRVLIPQPDCLKSCNGIKSKRTSAIEPPVSCPIGIRNTAEHPVCKYTGLFRRNEPVTGKKSCAVYIILKRY